MSPTKSVSGSPINSRRNTDDHMTFFFIFSILFLLGAIYNLFKGNFQEMLGGFVVSAVFFAIYFTRLRKYEKEVATLEAQDGKALYCCKCGSRTDVSNRAYLLTYSVIFYSSKSPGKFRSICKRCSVIA